MIALSSFLCGLHCQRQLYGLIFTKKQIVQERSARWDLWHFGLYCGVVRSHPQFHQHVDVIFSLGYKVANCLGSFEFKTTLVVMMVWTVVTKVRNMMLKLTFILSSLSMEPIAAGMPQTFRASTRILPTGRFDNLLLMSAVYSLFRITSVSSNNKNPIIGMSERLNGVNWTRTPLARTSGPHMTNDMSLDSFVFISNSCKRMYARHHQLSWHGLEGRPFSAVSTQWVTLSFSQ